MLWQRIQYTHLNPVAGRALVDHPNEMAFVERPNLSRSAPSEDEPLQVDLDKIAWRRSEA